VRRWLGATTLQGAELLIRTRDKAWTMLVSGAFERFGPRSTLAWPTRLAGVEHIGVGRRVYLGPGSWLQTLSRPDTPAPRIHVGDGVSSAGTLTLSAVQEIVVEDGVLFARNVYVSDHIHRFEDRDRAVQDQGLDKVAPVRIGAGAWLGQNVVVCPGVTIGAGAVVGANSVVTKNLPARCVAVGAPAHVVRTF
jgi:acetyltransferase-like isoleucine patch superfamily enzyme